MAARLEEPAQVCPTYQSPLTRAPVCAFREMDDSKDYAFCKRWIRPAATSGRSSMPILGHVGVFRYGMHSRLVSTRSAMRHDCSLTLEFTILTAARSGEVFGARWSEIDLHALVWTIPGKRMKAGREHRVPLAPRAMEILDKLTLFRKSDSSEGFVFPSRRPDRPFSNMTMQMMLRRSATGRCYTVHGFRWAGECTSFPVTRGGRSGPPCRREPKRTDNVIRS